jgi:hypothetical protein
MANSKAKLKRNSDKKSPWFRQLPQIIHNESLGPNAALHLLVCSEYRISIKFNRIFLLQNTSDSNYMAADIYTEHVDR